ncbi:uncharacterized protein LOC132177210 [Corylus avellana]|uniref:uncharacterized protein LOC132177210 n=1 Tax=Corylus avellana TaxID=13451 RepID=UPI00286C1B0A|nr:uncharacterized protein LOC132177210 [Corylus avellana]
MVSSFKLNCDAALDSKGGIMGFGIIVRDWVGKVFTAKIFSQNGALEPTAAEAMAVFYGVKFCQENGLHKIIIESDANRVTTAIQNRGGKTCRFGHLMDDILLILGSFPSEVRHVKRKANKAAHGLTRAAIKQVIDAIWVEEIPPCIRNIVLTEFSAL